MLELVLRRINFIKKDTFPCPSALGWESDSGDYHTAWEKALESVGYDKLRVEQAQQIELQGGQNAQADGHRSDPFHRDRRRGAGEEL